MVSGPLPSVDRAHSGTDLTVGRETRPKSVLDPSDVPETVEKRPSQRTSLRTGRFDSVLDVETLHLLNNSHHVTVRLLVALFGWSTGKARASTSLG